MPAPASTRFALHYRPEGRTLTLKARAAALAPLHLPAHFAETSLAYLAPVADEVAPDFASAFPNAAVGAGAQGWCREWDRDGQVTMRPWPDPRPVLSRIQALFLSSDDVAGWEERALALYQHVPLGALTLAARGAVLFVNGERYPVAPAPAVEVEPTGAGDVFAARLPDPLQRDRRPPRGGRVRRRRGRHHRRGRGHRGHPDPRSARPSVGRVPASLTFAADPAVVVLGHDPQQPEDHDHAERHSEEPEQQRHHDVPLSIDPAGGDSKADAGADGGA